MKRITALIIAVTMLFSVFYISPKEVSAAPESELYNIFAKETETKADSAGKKLVDNYGETVFESDSKDFTVTKTELNGKSSQTIEKTDDEANWSVTIYGEYETKHDLTSFNEIYFQFYAASANDESITLTMTLHSDRSTQSLTKKLPTGKLLDVYYPIENFEFRDSIDKISFTFECPEETKTITVSTLYADSLYSYSHLTLFSSDRITSKYGIDFFEDRLELKLEESMADVTARFSNVTPATSTVCAMITVSGAVSGTVTLSVWDGVSKEYTDVSTLTLYEGKNSYPFVFPSYKGTDTFRLSFSGINTADGEVLTLNGAVMTCFDEAIEEKNEYPGSIASCTVLESGSKIRISGTLRSSSVVNNIGAKLNVYAVNTLWQTESSAPVFLSSVDITTVFEITCITDSLKYNPYFYRYYITISNGEDETVASPTVYPSIPPSNFTMGNSVLGIQSNDSSAAFRTNASHAVVDIDLDKLLNTDGIGGRVHSFGGSFRYLSGSYISELDSKINFLNGSGVNVYLRILNSQPYTDAPCVYALPDCSNYNETLSYMTMIDFLTSRYSEISGLIIGSRVDCELYSYSNGSSLIAKAKNYTELVRLTSIVARANAPEAEMIIPFGDGYVYGGDGDGAEYVYNKLSGIGENAVSPAMIAELISLFISNCGSFKWYLLYECESAPEIAMSTVYRTSASLTQSGGTSPSGHMVFWQPEKLMTGEEIKTLAENVSENAIAFGTGAVIISMNKQSVDTETLLNIIESSNFGENSSKKVVNHEALVIMRPAATGNVHLWDFSNSFSTSGFISGGSVSSLSTEVSAPMATFEGVETCRALKGIIDTESKSSGTVLCYFDRPKLLNNATAVDVSVNLTSSKSEVPVKIILGKGNVRYEYVAKVSPETPSVIRCDTGIIDESFAAEYIAVSFEPDTASAFEITKISAVNKNLSKEELLQRLNNSQNEAGNITLQSKKVIMPIFFIGITVVGFAILNVRNSSDKKSKNKQIKK